MDLKVLYIELFDLMCLSVLFIVVKCLILLFWLNAVARLTEFSFNLNVFNRERNDGDKEVLFVDGDMILLEMWFKYDCVVFCMFVVVCVMWFMVFIIILVIARFFFVETSIELKVIMFLGLRIDVFIILVIFLCMLISLFLYLCVICICFLCLVMSCSFKFRIFVSYKRVDFGDVVLWSCLIFFVCFLLILLIFFNFYWSFVIVF